jgi:inorganic pyrophosphatase
MSKKAKNQSGAMANPSRLKPVSKKDDLVRVIVETPKGSRNKYAFDPRHQIFTLKKVLPAGMSFPYDFGFVPQTEAEDGDPLDVLILMEEPAFAGCMIQCRLIGVIEGEQQEKDGKKQRNDRLLAVESGSHFYSEIKHVDELPRQLLREIGEFFVNYHRLDGRRFRVIGVKGPVEARKHIAADRIAA